MFRSDPYLAFVRGHVCCSPWCIKPADHAHHHSRSAGGGGTGCKVHDTFSVPLCVDCHRFVHDNGHIAVLTSFETEVLFQRVSLLLVTEWLKERQNG